MNAAGLTYEEATRRIEAELDERFPEWRAPRSPEAWLSIELFERDGIFDYQIDASPAKEQLGEEIVMRALGERKGERLN